MYVDTLLFVNIIVNYFLLLMTAFFTKCPKKRWRVALGAGFGALFSLVVLLPALPVALSVLIKIAGAAGMAIVAFGAKNGRFVFKNFAYLFLASSLLAGVVIAVGEFGDTDVFYAKNFGIYLDLSPLLLIIIALTSYLILCLFDLLFRNPKRTARSCTASVKIGDRELDVQLMIDSGHQLSDPLTGRDVLILKKKLSARLLDEHQRAALVYGSAASAELLGRIGDFSMLPFTSLGGTGLLLGFGAKNCTVTRNQGKPITIERPYVAFTDEDLPFEVDGIIGGDTMGLE